MAHLIRNGVDFGSRNLAEIMSEISPTDLEFRVVYESLGETVFHPVTREPHHVSYRGNVLFVRSQYDDIYIGVFPMLRYGELYQDHPCILVFIGQFRMAFQYDMKYADNARSHLTWEIHNAGERLSATLYSGNLDQSVKWRNLRQLDLVTARNFKTQQEQDYVLEVLKRGLSIFNHTTTSQLCWPDGRVVTDEERFASDVYNKDGSLNIKATLDNALEAQEKNGWFDKYEIKKLGSTNVEFSPHLIARIEKGEFIK